MKKDNAPSTTIILDMLNNKHMSVNDIVEQISFPSLPDFLNEMIGRADISIDALADYIEINRSTIYRILNQKINPSRDKLLRFAFALHMSYDETKILLKCGNCATLSSSRPRDIYIMNGIQKKKTLTEVNIDLFEHDFIDLCGNKPQSLFSK